MRQSLASSTAALAQLTGELVELGLEALDEREGVRGATGEARQHAAVLERERTFTAAVFLDLVAQGDLAVASEHGACRPCESRESSSCGSPALEARPALPQGGNRVGSCQIMRGDEPGFGGSVPVGRFFLHPACHGTIPPITSRSIL